MADIRIKDLATTATSAASDDYLALDGSANGTRKILATNVAQNVTDVTFGSSGPSAKSSIAARASRQGLVFDGTTGGSFILTSTQSGSWSTDQTALIPSSNPSAAVGFFSMGGAYASEASFAMYLSSGGVLVVEQCTASPSSYRTATISGFISTYGGKFVRIATTVSGGVLSVYVNGISATYTETTFGGSPPSWGATLTPSATSFFGKLQTSNYYYNSRLGPLYIYNRALSAAEVVSLYEAGVPAGSDYNTASNTSKLTGANSDFSSAGNWTVTGATTISGGKLNLSNGDQAYCIPGTISVPIGAKFRVTITVDSITAGSVQVYTGGTGGWVNIATAAGTFTQEFTFSATTGTNTAINLKSVGGNAVVDTVLYYQIGLLLAPDAGQAGNGYVWNDQSGNLAQIVLPSSGVQWALPSVAGQRIRGTTSTNGNQQLLGASVLLPAECQITHVRARARSGTPTITIGTASGGAQIVASVALSTTWLNCTIALTGGIVSSADDIWIGSNSTDVVETDIAFQPLDF